jgi:hypothetical protein
MYDNGNPEMGGVPKNFFRTDPEIQCAHSRFLMLSTYSHAENTAHAIRR